MTKQVLVCGKYSHMHDDPSNAVNIGLEPPPPSSTNVDEPSAKTNISHGVQYS